MKRLLLASFLCGLAVLSCAKTKSVPPSPRPSGEALGQVVTHLVEPGETWRSLARDFYGDEGRAQELARDNGSDASTPPSTGSAVRVILTFREADAARARIDAAREYNAGIDLAAEGDYAEAALKFEEALKLNPRFPEASFNLAIAYGKLKLQTKAIEILRRLVAASPDDVDYLYALGASLFDIGDYAGARRAFSNVLDRDSSHRKALFSFGVACEKTGKLDDARDAFERYLGLDPDGEWADAARSHLEALRSRR